MREIWPKIVLPAMKRIPIINWLEIGSFEGRSALWTVENMFRGKPLSRITCIDTWEPWIHYKNTPFFDYEKTFDLNRSGIEQIIKFKGNSNNVLSLLPQNHFHGALIDSSHMEQETLQEARLVLPLMAPPGIMVFDDYLWPEGDGVKRAVRRFPEGSGDQVRLIYKGYQAICRLLP